MYSSRQSFSGKFLGDAHEERLSSGVFDLHERARQFNASPGRQEAIERIVRCAHAVDGRRTADRIARRSTLEEKRGIGLQRAGDLHKAAAADTVGALLVFLHLLECEPELVAEPFLSLAQREPAAADAQADMADTFVVEFFEAVEAIAAVA